MPDWRFRGQLFLTEIPVSPNRNLPIFLRFCFSVHRVVNDTTPLVSPNYPNCSAVVQPILHDQLERRSDRGASGDYLAVFSFARFSISNQGAGFGGPIGEESCSTPLFRVQILGKMRAGGTRRPAGAESQNGMSSSLKLGGGSSLALSRAIAGAGRAAGGRF